MLLIMLTGVIISFIYYLKIKTKKQDKRETILNSPLDYQLLTEKIETKN